MIVRTSGHRIRSDKKLFGDRIISRDENGSMTAKSLARLFPVDTKMVVIIDDRADVWPQNQIGQEALWRSDNQPRRKRKHDGEESRTTFSCRHEDGGHYR